MPTPRNRNAAMPRWQPRSTHAPPTFADFEFLAHANNRKWRTVMNRLHLTEKAALLIRKRLVQCGLLKKKAHYFPMELTAYAYSIDRKYGLFARLNRDGAGPV